MVRSLTMMLLVLGFLEGLASVPILLTWHKVATEKAIRPVVGLITIAFFYLGLWNFTKGNYLLSAVSSAFFMIALLAFMLKPAIETWDVCNN